MGRVFERAEQYLDQLVPYGEFVELGTSRVGDDSSTRTIASWAERIGTKLITVDVDPHNCDLVSSWELPNTTVINSTGEDYFHKRIYTMRPVTFLYLNNFDWDWHPEKPEDFVLEQKQRYRMLGYDMTNLNSQAAHLQQMIYALPHMAEKSLVVCDDTWYNKWWGHYSGKSGAVVPFLLNHGFEVVYTEEQPVYGTILTRGIK